MGELLSPVEAILHNILGADNILVPPGSQVEEILQAIYYNTEYEKNPKSRVAEILLAIKNKGIYDGPVLSRVEDILVHKLNNIPYTKHKKEDLSRVEQLLLDWLEQGGGEEIIEYTGTFPMTILANGESLLDYLISGNTVQSGTPTPDSPIMPQGTGERTGNLYNINAKDVNNGYVNNAQLNQDGTIDTWVSCEVTEYIELVPNTSYRLSNIGSYNSIAYCVYDGDKQYITGEKYSGQIVKAINMPPNGKYLRFSHVKSKTDTMLNTGSTALPYEPYGYKLDISSANTTTPVYLGEVESTRRIKKLVLTGEENFSTDTYLRFSIYISDMKSSASRTGRSYCSHYECLYNAEPYDNDWNNVYYQSGGTLYFHDRRFAAVADFKSYLAQQYTNGTPVTVWYVLATEETAVVNEPLMRIGDYADTVSYAQAGADVPTNEKPTETVIDVQTSVKPSEGYIKYTEPTDGPTPKTQVLGTKDHEIYMTSNNEVYVLRR